MDLSSNSITQLPQNGELRELSRLAILVLSSNNLTSISAGLLPSSLTELTIYDNVVLSVIDERAFEGLSQLRELKLTDTLITSFPANLFAPLTALRSLDLSSNARLEQFSLDQFAASKQLEFIYANSLSSVPTTEWRKPATATLNVTLMFVAQPGQPILTSASLETLAPVFRGVPRRRFLQLFGLPAFVWFSRGGPLFFFTSRPSISVSLPRPQSPGFLSTPRSLSHNTVLVFLPLTAIHPDFMLMGFAHTADRWLPIHSTKCLPWSETTYQTFSHCKPESTVCCC